MTITDTNPIKVLCDRCGTDIKIGSGAPIAAIGVGYVKIFHNQPQCSGQEYQFLTATGASVRQITKAQLATEIANALA